jgi:hypothetical protein
MPAGFYNGEIMFADNVRFDGNNQPGQVTADGQLLIGSSVAPNIRVANLVSGDGSVTITNGNGTIDLSASGGGSVDTIAGDSGSITGANVTIYANNAGKIAGSTVKFVNSGTTSILNVTEVATANTIIGLGAGSLTATGGFNTGLGFQSLKVLSSGVQNCGVGYNSLALNTSGGANTAMGHGALASVATTSNNTAFGSDCLDVTTGSNNTAMGSGCLTSFTGSNNSAFGYLAGRDTSGTGNSIFGFLAMVNATSGTNNACFGYQALTSLGSGSTNTAFGYNAGSSLTGTDSSNILIANTGTVGDNNTVRIGTDGSGAGQVDTTFIAGIAGVTVANSAAVLIDTTTGQLGTVVSSERYKENIVDMSENVSVLKLRPVSFNYKLDVDELQYGLIAEEVSKDFPYLCVYKNGKPETVKYHELCIFLLAEIQRLEKRMCLLESK